MATFVNKFWLILAFQLCLLTIRSSAYFFMYSNYITIFGYVHVLAQKPSPKGHKIYNLVEAFISAQFLSKLLKEARAGCGLKNRLRKFFFKLHM